MLKTNYNNASKDKNYDNNNWGQKRENNIPNRENASSKLKNSKWYMRSKAIYNNPEIDDVLTDIYYDDSKRKKLKEGVDAGYTAVECIKTELVQRFKNLTNVEKQGIRNVFSTNA